MGVSTAKHFLQSFYMWNYRFEIKSLPGLVLLQTMNLHFANVLSTEEQDELKFYEVAVKSCLFTRDVQNTRANIANPDYMEYLIKVSIVIQHLI